MKRAMIAVLGILALAIVSSPGAAAVKTNWVETVNITLNAWEDGQAKPVAINTKSVLTSLGHTTTGARLLFKQSGSNSTFIVRVGKTDTDVTSSFTQTKGNLTATKTIGTTSTIRSVDTYNFAGTNLTFDVSGFTVETRGPAVRNGAEVSKSLTAKVAGEGNVGTGASNNAVIEGTISLSGGRLE